MPQSPIRVQMPDGKIAEFPSGMTSDQIEMAIKGASQPAKIPPFNPPRFNAKAHGEGGKMTPQELERSKSMLPLVGAAIGAGLTGGAGIPAIIASGVGGGAGQAIKDLQYTGSMKDRAMNVAKSAIGAAATQGVGEAAAYLAPTVARAARNLWNRSAKITEPIAKTTQAMRAGGTLTDAKNEIAETVLSQGAGTLRKGNLDALKSTLDGLDDQLDTVIAGSQAFVKRQELRDALIARSRDIGQGTIAQEVQQQALGEAFDLLNKKPARMTIQEAQKTKREIYSAWSKTFAADAAEGARAMADKTTARTLRGAIEREAPESATINAAMSKQIPAVKAVEKAVSRTGNRDALGLSQMLAGVSPNPVTLAGALLNHPLIGSFTAQQLHKAAKALGTAERTAPNIIRVAKALFGGEE